MDNRPHVLIPYGVPYELRRKFFVLYKNKPEDMVRVGKDPLPARVCRPAPSTGEILEHEIDTKNIKDYDMDIYQYLALHTIHGMSHG